MSIIDTLPTVKGEYRFNFPLNKTNWFNVGGPAEILFKPLDLEDLIFFFKNKPEGIDTQIFGVGSNIIIRDGGINGVVIKLGRNFSNIELISPNLIKVGASCLNYNLAHFCADNNLSGLEFLIGIPGSVGGGIAMNAGAYGAEFKDFVKEVKALDENGNIHIISHQDMGFIYRGNAIKEKMIFIEAVFELSYNDSDKIHSLMQEISTKREETQPIKEKTTGSTFANPKGYSAWKLIDEAGLRGFKIGGASMSEKHSNFMINDGTATAKDLEDLGEYVREKVFNNSGVMLEWEVKRIGKKL